MKGKLKIQKGSRGITLIALVITIIVLLILAAISIATLTGENGILTKANGAKSQTAIGEEKEQISLAYSAVMANKMKEKDDSGVTSTELQGELNNLNANATATPDNNKIKVTFNKTGNVYTINSEGRIEGPTNSGGNEGTTQKTVAELYDGINNPDDENYNEDAMHIGDWVNYTAGTWEETVAYPSSSTPFGFGGYNAGQKRDESVSAASLAVCDGWRIWDIDEENKTMTLISAGSPEYFRHKFYSNNGFISEYVLTGNIDEQADAEDLGLGETYTPRDWSMYKNTAQYANGARALTYRDLDTWYKKYIDPNIEGVYKINGFDYDEYFPANDRNKLISIVNNGISYWLCDGWYVTPGGIDGSSLGMDMVYCMSNGDCSLWDFNEYDTISATQGVRVLVSLTSEVIFEETPEKVTQGEFTYNKWIIENKS